MRMDKKCMVMTRITKKAAPEGYAESERDKCECDKVMERKEGKREGGRERERETFLMACCFWIERRANEKWR